MVQKKGHTAAVKYHLVGLITAVGVVSALWCQSFVSLADSTGKVNVDSAVIRKEASAGSEAVGSASRGNTVTIKDEVQDSSGTLWYQVYVDGNTTGYIRSDLVDKQGGDSDTGSQSDAGQNAAQQESSASGASIDPGTFIDPQYAVVSANSIKVRTAPSTNEAVVDRLTKDAQVIVSGQSDGSDGKLWYYVTFTGTNGAERTGYIRSDLLSLGDMVPIPEEETPEPQEIVPEEPEAPVNDDYKLTCEPGPDGSDVWYLYDYTSGTGQSDKYLLSQLMEATRVRSENDAADAKTIVRQRIVIVVLIVLVVLLIVAGVIMALKLRDVYYEDYEDEDEEEEEDPSLQRRKREREAGETSSQRRRRTGEEEASPQRKKREREEETSSQRRRRTEEEEPVQRRRRAAEPEESTERRRRRAEEDDATARRRRRMEEEETETDSVAGKSAPKRKTKNFLLDDDEFEFEFLNMDDKK